MPDFKILPTVNGVGVLLRDGSQTLTADWDIGEDRAIKAEKLQARDNEGLSIYDSGGTLRAMMLDNGSIAFGRATALTVADMQAAASATDAYMTIEAPATTSKGETIAIFKVTDDASYVTINNVATVDARLSPRLTYRNLGTTALSLGVYSEMLASADAGTTALMNFGGLIRDSAGTASVVATRPLFRWVNNATTLWTMAASGKFGTLTTPLALVHLSQTQTTGEALRVERALAAASTDSPLVNFINTDAGDDMIALNVEQYGTNYAINVRGANAKASSTASSLLGMYSNDATNPLGFSFNINGNATAALRYTTIHSLESGVSFRPLVLNPNSDIAVGTTDVEAWNSSYVGIQFGSQAFLMAGRSGSSFTLGDNLYFDAAGWKWRTTAPAAMYSSDSGNIYLYVAPSGTVDTVVGSAFKVGLAVANSGLVGVGIYPPSSNGIFQVYDTTQLRARVILSGQEFYQASNTATEGFALLLGVNRTGNRQLWMADSAKLAVNTTNPVLRFILTTTANIDAVSTNGTTVLPLTLNSGGGNVGVNIAAPLYPFHVRVGTNQTLLVSSYSGLTRLSTANDANNAPVPLYLDASTMYMQAFGGVVAIGDTTGPGIESTALLTVMGSSASGIYASVLNSGAGQVALGLNRTGTTPVRWVVYIGIGATDLNFYNSVVGQVINFTTAGGATFAGNVIVPYLGIGSAAGVQVYEAFSVGGVDKAYIGAAGAAGNLITGAAAGDVAIRSQGGKILFSVDSGATIGVQIASSGNITTTGFINVASTGVFGGRVVITAPDFAANTPALSITQQDLSEELIEFNTTVAAGNPVDTAAIGTYYGKVRVSVNGTFKYIPMYNS